MFSQCITFHRFFPIFILGATYLKRQCQFLLRRSRWTSWNLSKDFNVLILRTEGKTITYSLVMLYKGIFVSCCSGISWSGSHKFCQSLSRKLNSHYFWHFWRKDLSVYADMRPSWRMCDARNMVFVNSVMFAHSRILTKIPSALCCTANTRFILRAQLQLQYI